MSLQFYSYGTSFPNIRFSSLKQANKDDSEIPGSCLDRLAEDGDSKAVALGFYYVYFKSNDNFNAHYKKISLFYVDIIHAII